MNTANKITILRILMIPIFMIVLMVKESFYCDIAAAIIFIIAAATDGVDGYVARKYNQITDFGKFIDPLADKLLVFSALLCFIQMNITSVWAPIIIIAREFFVTSMRVVAVSKGKVIAASWWGKIKTNIQLFSIIGSMSLFVLSEWKMLNMSKATFWADILIWAAAIFTVASWIAYVFENIAVFKDEKN